MTGIFFRLISKQFWFELDKAVGFSDQTPNDFGLSQTKQFVGVDCVSESDEAVGRMLGIQCFPIGFNDIGL